MHNIVRIAGTFFVAGLLLYLNNGYTQTLFPNSVASHSIDLISEDYPTVDGSVEFLERAKSEMPGARENQLMDDNTYVFRLSFEDNTTVLVFAHSDFDTREEAHRYVNSLLGPLGKLPTQMRDVLVRVVINKSNHGAFSEHLGNFFVLSSGIIEKRLQNHDLEETVFHESVHATLDAKYRDTPEWINAQRLDGVFVTDYAKDRPSEDLAETALFVFSLRHKSTQMPDRMQEWIKSRIPHRQQFINKLFDTM